jgi:flagellar biosynthesis protein FlhF
LLKNYAQLCGLKYHEISNAVEFAAVLASARRESVDTIFVDLPGLPRGKSMPEMLDYFGMMDPDNALHLAVTPHYGETAMRALAARYVPDTMRQSASLVWTKLDEADSFGALVNVGGASRLPATALSCGPELNDTLVPAESAALWRLLFKKEMPCRPHPDSAGF